MRISGPFVSRIVATGRPSSSRTRFSFCSVASWDSCVPWEKLNLAAFMPARISWRRVSLIVHRGPQCAYDLCLSQFRHNCYLFPCFLAIVSLLPPLSYYIFCRLNICFLLKSRGTGRGAARKTAAAIFEIRQFRQISVFLLTHSGFLRIIFKHISRAAKLCFYSVCAVCPPSRASHPRQGPDVSDTLE